MYTYSKNLSLTLLGVYEQNGIVNSFRADDWTPEWAINEFFDNSKPMVAQFAQLVQLTQLVQMAQLA